MPIVNEVTEINAVPKFGIDASALRIKKITLDDARDGIRLDITGTFLYAITASSKTVKMDVAFNEQSQDGIPYKQGQFISGVIFSQIYITNLAQAGGYITVLYGVETSSGLKIQNPADQYNDISILKETVLSTLADVALVAGATTQIAVADATRKSVLVTNLAANAQYIRVGDVNTGAARGTEIAPGMTITLDVTDNVYAYCVGAQSVSLTFIKD